MGKTVATGGAKSRRRISPVIAVPTEPTRMEAAVSAAARVPGPRLVQVASITGEQRFLVDGVAADMILAILQHQEEIERYEKGALELHWGNGPLVGRIHPLWPFAFTARMAADFAAPGYQLPTEDRTALDGDVVAAGAEAVIYTGSETPPWGR